MDDAETLQTFESQERLREVEPCALDGELRRKKVGRNVPAAAERLGRNTCQPQRRWAARKAYRQQVVIFGIMPAGDQRQNEASRVATFSDRPKQPLFPDDIFKPPAFGDDFETVDLLRRLVAH